MSNPRGADEILGDTRLMSPGRWDRRANCRGRKSPACPFPGRRARNSGSTPEGGHIRRRFSPACRRGARCSGRSWGPPAQPGRAGAGTGFKIVQQSPAERWSRARGLRRWCAPARRGLRRLAAPHAATIQRIRVARSSACSQNDLRAHLFRSGLHDLRSGSLKLPIGGQYGRPLGTADGPPCRAAHFSRAPRLKFGPQADRLSSGSFRGSNARPRAVLRALLRSELTSDHFAAGFHQRG